MLAGVAATGEEEVFSIMSAGIFFFDANIPQRQRNYGPRSQNGQKMLRAELVSACGESVRSRLKREEEETEGGGKKRKKNVLRSSLESGSDVLRASAAAAREGGCGSVRASVCVRVSETLRVWLLFISPAARERLV